MRSVHDFHSKNELSLLLGMVVQLEVVKVGETRELIHIDLKHCERSRRVILITCLNFLKKSSNFISCWILSFSELVMSSRLLLAIREVDDILGFYRTIGFCRTMINSILLISLSQQA